MPGYDELIHISATVEAQKLAEEKSGKKSFLDYFSLAVTTFGVGYLPLAPGTYGSAVGVLIYLIFRWIEAESVSAFTLQGWQETQITAWIHVFIAFLFLLFCLLGIWAASRATKLFKNKDPQQAVVDEIIGQLLVFLFVPFDISWKLILAGFLLFRLFDIWKPYPIDSLQNLPAGIGVCADDILAGVYGGAILSLLYAMSLII
ncbi:MAG: phosphatidylglycerophosphatase A [Acidobacteriota bacterium]|nr:phosphatidylglycerophosphatase A [Acidobacteriota bacterium]